MKRLIASAAVALLSFPAVAATTWEIDPAHSSVTFSVKHMMVSTVRGEFGKLSGTVTTDGKDLTKATVEAAIDVTSINTRDAKRDGHLKSADFFDAEKYPSATFKSKKVAKAGKGLKITGDLTLHGVTKEVVLEVTGPSAETKTPFGTTIMSASATTTIKRKDFGVSWNKALDGGGLLVGEEVPLAIDLELTKKEAPADKPADKPEEKAPPAKK